MITSLVGTVADVRPVPIPIDCVDGFAEAYYARPERLFDPRVRASQSAWGFIGDDAETRAVHRLSRDLDSGAWDSRHGHLCHEPEFAGSLRLVVGRP